jgi:hypothetical protein
VNGIALVRFVHHDETHGHFEPLLQKQLINCQVQSMASVFWDLSTEDFQNRIEALREKLVASNVKHVYFEWLHDLPSIPQIDSILAKIGVTWSVLASISEYWQIQNQDSEFILWMEQLSNAKQLTNVFVWDKYVFLKMASLSIPFSVVADYQNVETDDTSYDCCGWVSGLSEPLIGVAGQLYGYRGVTNLIRIAFLKPKLNYIFWGIGRWSTVGFLDKFLITKLISKKRIYISDSFKSSDTELNHLFKHIDAMYIDGSRYPNPSGMVTRARNFGIPVLVEKGDGFYFYESKIDRGISMDNFLLMPTALLRKRIVRLAKLPLIPAPSEDSQVLAFINAWRNSLG